jgi:hypothetical protein
MLDDLRLRITLQWTRLSGRAVILYSSTVTSRPEHARTYETQRGRKSTRKKEMGALGPYLAVAYVQSHDTSGRIAIDEMSLD